MKRFALPVVYGVLALALSWGVSGCGTLSDALSSPPAIPQSPADQQLRVDILNRLQNDPLASQASYSVFVRSGVITLHGTVSDANARRHILSIVKATPGVVDVQDRLAR